MLEILVPLFITYRVGEGYIQGKKIRPTGYGFNTLDTTKMVF